MCNLGRLCTVLCENMPTPAWIKYPQPERFCCCCSIRTGASVIGWFTFVFNALYTGMLMLSLAKISDKVDDILQNSLVENIDLSKSQFLEYSGEELTAHYDVDNIKPVHDAPLIDIEQLKYVHDFVLPMMYKTVCIPGMMIIFSVLWLTAVEGRVIYYLRIAGHALILAIVIQLILLLGLLGYAEARSRGMGSVNVSGGTIGVSWIVWLIYAIYALINLYFVPVLYEYIQRRVKEHNQGLDQGLLTSDMFPRARVAEAYIEDAFTLDGEGGDPNFQISDTHDNDEVQYTNDDEPTTKGGYQRF